MLTKLKMIISNSNIEENLKNMARQQNLWVQGGSLSLPS
jgi:hypothetical protein